MVVVVREELAAPAETTRRTRRLPNKLAMPLYTQPGEMHRVIVKFKDALVARADSKANQLMLTKGPVDELQLLMDQYDFENRAARKSGRSQPDFAGIMTVVMPDCGAEKSLEVAMDLRALDIVEYVELDTPESPPPPPSDYAPTTPDLSANQGYRRPDPGIDIEYAWSNGYKGAGIRVSDCEYGFHTNHEDLVDSTLTVEIAPGESVNPNYIDHGTAVLGVLGAAENAYGMNGLIPEATFHFYSEEPASGHDPYTAVASAIADSASGDIVLLEIQSTYGAPAEFSQSVWDITKTGTDAGVIVVAAAGNGAEDLDSATYSAYRFRGDSGAIIVGAGTSDTNHSRLSFSTYGTRVNLQSWGGLVASLGYGDLAEYGEDINQRYTASFNGTSSASPIVAGACVALQNFIEQTQGFRLLPLEMRQLLVETGTPQGPGMAGHIGSQPNVRTAMLEAESHELIRITASTNTMRITEGATNSFSLKLLEQPSRTVTVNVSRLSGSTNIQVISNPALIFTTNTWSDWKSVDIYAVTGGNFADYEAVLRCAPERFFYTDIPVTSFDGTQGILVSTNSLIIPEWEQNTFSVRLAALPDHATTVQVVRSAGDTNIVVRSGALLEFDPSNWSVWQTVRVQATYDEDAIHGEATLSCSSTGLVSIPIAVTEDDEPRTIFYEERLNSDPGWTTNGDWAFGIPTGQGGDDSFDPTSGFTGTNVYGNNLNGAYHETLTAEYLTVSSPIDCSAHTNINLYFYRWLGVELPAYDQASIDASTNGADWVSVWTNNTDYLDEAWSLQTVDISSVADAQSTVYLRWGMKADDLYHYCGWNLDDIRLLGQSTASADTDDDGLPDSWEEQYWPGDLSQNPGDPATNPDYTVWQCYIAGISPVDPDATFRISDLQPLTSVLSWNPVTGRVYSVYWTSNLLSGFDIPLQTNYTGGVFTDSTHSVETKGFYKIDVQLED